MPNWAIENSTLFVTINHLKIIPSVLIDQWKVEIYTIIFRAVWTSLNSQKATLAYPQTRTAIQLSNDELLDNL